MAVMETRGSGFRVNWRLGGSRTGARQSCTFSAADPQGPRELADAKKLAAFAKGIVESRGHALTRGELYDLVIGKADVDVTVPTFKEWVGTYIADRRRMRDVQPDVIVYYERMLTARAVPHLGHLRLTEIDHEALRSWVAWMSSSRITIGSKNRRAGDRLLSSSTIRRAHAIVHACLGAAVPKWLAVNPAARAAGSSKHSTGLPRKAPFQGMFLSDDEVRMILDHCDEHIRDMVQVAVSTGMRLGELVALQARFVVFDRDGHATVLVRQALKNDLTVGEPKSEMSRRDITVDVAASRILRARVEGRKPSSLVFPSPRGGMWDEGNFRDRYWYRAVAAAMRCVEHPPPAPVKPARGPARALRHNEVSSCLCQSRLQRRPRFHDLRHTHASALIADGWHAKKIQVRLGHANYQTTMNVYGHLIDSGSRDELQGIADRFAARPVVEDVVTPRRRGGSSARRVRGGRVRRLLVRR